MSALDSRKECRTIEDSITRTSKAARKFSAHERLQFFVAAGLTTEEAARKALAKHVSEETAANRSPRTRKKMR